MLKKALPFIVSIAIALGIGFLSAYITRGNMDLYANIAKPAIAPPAILFPIVWTVLYILMGISAAIIYNNRDQEGAKSALLVYAVSLIINFIWSPVFFNNQNFLLAFLIIILLWITVLITILKYSTINKTAAFLQIPYLLWVTFAAYICFSVYALNR